MLILAAVMSAMGGIGVWIVRELSRLGQVVAGLTATVTALGGQVARIEGRGCDGRRPD